MSTPRRAAARRLLATLLLPVTLVLAMQLLAGCAGEPPRSDPDYVVQDNDTLYSIAWRRDLDYRELARWNGIGADYRITVGQRLRLTPPAATAATAATGATPRAERPSPAPAPAPAMGQGAVQWSWPTEPHGKPVPARNGGLLFAGQPGQAVRAAARGRVVYTGSGIRGYGQLIIIKHSETLLSAYAYNDQVMVREGQDVAAGTPIATMGQGPHQAAALYFEIRVNGRPSDARKLLQGVK